MIASSVDEHSTVADIWARAVDRFHDRPFLAVPARADRDYLPEGCEIGYGEAARQVADLIARYRDAGIGLGHRVALLLDNRPEHFLHKIALNSLGASAVPVNPDYRAAEIAYLIGHCKADAAVVLETRAQQLARGVAESGRVVPTVTMERFAMGAPSPLRRAENGTFDGLREASILYTSGTTGRPKGCILSQGYEIGCGAWLALRGGLATPIEGQDRLYTTLPLYHVTSWLYTIYRVMVTGGCQIQSDRFSPTRWWREVVDSRATVIQYLGVLTSILAAQPPTQEERAHSVRYGAGASVDPQLHAQLEERWGFPLIEQWGMTEICRCTGTYHEPRKVGTRACGPPAPELEVRVVDESDRDVPRGDPGELVVRHSAATPRARFFSGYLDDEAATEGAWRGGWFHTGDVVTQDDDGMLHFVERRKNIIRRSGENIAAAEVEAVLRLHESVRQVAVLSVPDELREEEVLACVVLRDGAGSQEAAQKLFDFCFRQLSYFKAPGWIYFAGDLPMTGSLKIQKHQIFPGGVDPRALDGIFDLRPQKKRSADAP